MTNLLKIIPITAPMSVAVTFATCPCGWTSFQRSQPSSKPMAMLPIKVSIFYLPYALYLSAVTTNKWKHTRKPRSLQDEILYNLVLRTEASGDYHVTPRPPRNED